MTGRILVASYPYPPLIFGGAEIVAHRQARQLQQRGWEVTVLAGTVPGGTAGGEQLGLDWQDGIETYRLVVPSLELAENFRAQAADDYLRALLARLRPDWVHLHNPLGLGVELILIAKRAGAKVAVTLHDNWGYCFKNTRLRNDNSPCNDVEECHLCQPRVRLASGTVLPQRFRRDYVAWCLNRADQLISPSRHLAHSYAEAGFPERRIALVSNGIDLDGVPIAERGGRGAHSPAEFLCGAYIGEHKGIPVLLEAARILHRDATLRGAWHLTIAGSGHLAPQVERAIAQGEFGNAVDFVGRLPAAVLRQRLAATTALVVPSIWPENEPVIILEAIAAGIAVIASNLGGNTELIEPEVSGLLCAPDDAAALAAAMRRLIVDPELAASFGARNHQRREAYDERRSIDRLIGLLGRHPGEPRDEREPVLICGGGSPDFETEMAVDLLAKAMPGQRLRLIWEEWAGEEAWEAAAGYWNWSPNAPLTALSRAISRGVPMVLRQSEAGDLLRRVVDRVVAYQGCGELPSLFAGLLANGAPRFRNTSGKGFPRFYNQLRASSDFSFLTET